MSDTVRQARRILTACEQLRQELASAEELCSARPSGELDRERREVLASVVRQLQTGPSAASLSLLAHLSRQ